MRTFTDFQRLSETRKRKLANNTYLVVRDDGGFGIRLHATEVIIHYADHIILNSGGYQTVTTKARMNDFSNARVFSENGVWIISWQGKTYAYADHMELFDNGTVTGEGVDPKATQKLRKRVINYSKAYATAFLAGDVPAPSGGDCWACSMITSDGKAPMGGADHILNHLDEKYYVPSILSRMFDAGTLSLYAKDFIGRTWSPDHESPTVVRDDIVLDQIYKTVKKFCFRELGLAS